VDDVVELEGVVRLREALQVQRVVLQRAPEYGKKVRALFWPAPAGRRDRIWDLKRASWERGDGSDLVADDGDADDHVSAGAS
jgi:hypothetical protein